MRRFFVFLSFLIFTSALMAQDTLTVMQYNLLQYGNYQGYGGCSESTNSTQLKDYSIRIIMDYVKPDILTVCEFGATQQLQTTFLRSNLNINGADYWKSDNIMNGMNSNIINHIFYDSRKMEMSKHISLPTSPRNVDVYEMYLKTSSLIAGDTIKLVCIVAHLKAGTDSESARLATMTTVMNYVSTHYANDNVLIMGDFNLYRATEGAYQILTKTYGNTSALFVDPLASVGGVGSWNNNSQFTRFHTQSTRTNGPCFSTGGLDDRFDFILTSDEIYMGSKKMKYIKDTYKAVGNDGLHFNKSIIQNGNNAVPAEVSQALYDCSDHLPVTMKMWVQMHLGVEEYTAANGFKVYPNPTTDVLTVDIVDKATYSISNVMGQTVMSGNINGENQQINVSALPNGLYFIRVNSVTRKFIKQ